MKQIISILTFILLNLNQAYAVNLTSLRAPADRAALEQEVGNQIQSIRAITTLAPGPVPQEFRALPEMRPFKKFGSSTIRDILDKASLRLIQQKNWGELEINDPSRFQEIEKDENDDLRDVNADEKKKKDLAVLNEVLAKDFEFLTQQIALEAAASADQPKATAADDARETALARVLETYLVANQTTLEKDERALNKEPAQNIEKVLGTLKTVEVYSNVPTRIIFETPSGKAVLTLTALISVRTDLDTYFVRTLELLLDRTQTELKPYLNKEGKIKSLKGAELVRALRLDVAKKSLEERVTGAQRNHEALTALSKRQLDYLIDVFLQLRGVDTPMAREIEPMSIRLSSNANPSEQDMTAYLYYVDLQKQIAYYVQNLENEERARKKIAPILDQIKSEKKL